MKKTDNVTSLGAKSEKRGDMTVDKSSEETSDKEANSSSKNSAKPEPKGEALDALLPIDEHFEEVSVGGKKERLAGIYLLPNLFTSGALFAGFYAIVAAMNGEFGLAGLAIFFGQMLDGLDGRVARLTNTQSKFGQEFDSLSDMVTFGLAPALIMFMWCLSGLGTLGWAVAFIYVASAAVRLARFNAQADTADNRYFTGLASPPAATLIASTVWLGHQYGYTSATLPGWLVATMTLQTAVVGFLMVMNVRYSSFKGIDLGSRQPVVALLFFIFMIVLIAANPPIVLFIIAFTYALSGPLIALFKLARNKDQAAD